MTITQLASVTPFDGGNGFSHPASVSSAEARSRLGAICVGPDTPTLSSRPADSRGRSSKSRRIGKFSRPMRKPPFGELRLANNTRSCFVSLPKPASDSAFELGNWATTNRLLKEAVGLQATRMPLLSFINFSRNLHFPSSSSSAAAQLEHATHDSLPTSQTENGMHAC